MELVEEHAYHTYDLFLMQEGETLKAQPAPPVALEYYQTGDLYLFDAFQTAHLPQERRPVINNLYDVFVAIRDDEREHVKTMVACQQADQTGRLGKEPLRELQPNTVAEPVFTEPVLLEKAQEKEAVTHP